MPSFGGVRGIYLLWKFDFLWETYMTSIHGKTDKLHG